MLRSIKQMQQPKVILTRPPGFGKTTFCKMLGAYVDSRTPEDTHARHFHGTAIHKLETEGDEATRGILQEFKRNCAWLELVRTWEESSGSGIGPNLTATADNC
jgi:hypothetical protein